MTRSAQAECPRCEASVRVLGEDIGRPCVCGGCHTTLVVHPVPRPPVPRDVLPWILSVTGGFAGISLIAALLAFQAAAPEPASPAASKFTAPASESADPASESADPAAGIFAAVTGSVVAIDVQSTTPAMAGQGSGFVVHPDGWVVTNAHVVEDLASGRIHFDGGRPRPFTRVHAIDRRRDLAVVKLPARGLQALSLAPDLPAVGSRVFAIGSPGGLRNSLSDGLVSGIRDIDSGVTIIQSTASISPGSSGGALVDASGRLVGVTTAGIDPSVANDIYLAVSVRDLRDFLAEHGIPLP